MAIAALIREVELHRDVYPDPDVFELEMHHLWAHARQHVGHASQVPNLGDYLATALAGQPVIMIRHGDSAGCGAQPPFNRGTPVTCRDRR